MNYLNVSKESAAFWRVSINNPPLNLVDSRFIIDMHELMDAAEADTDLQVIVFESANPEYFLHTGISPTTCPFWQTRPRRRRE